MQGSNEFKSLFKKLKKAYQKSLDKIQELPLDEVEKLRHETSLLFENFDEKSEKVLFERSKRRKKDLTQFCDLQLDDIWATVFSYFEINDLLNALRVSKYFNSIIENHPIAISSIPFKSFEKKVRFFERFVKKRYNNIKMVTVCPSYFNHCLKYNIIFRGCKEIKTSEHFPGYSGYSFVQPPGFDKWICHIFTIFPNAIKFTYKWEYCMGKEEGFSLKGRQIRTLDASKMMLDDFSHSFPFLKRVRLKSDNAKVLASLLTKCLNLEEVNINARGISDISGLEGRSILENLKVLKLHFQRIHRVVGSDYDYNLNISDVVPNFVRYFSNVKTLRVFWFSFSRYIYRQRTKNFVESKLRGSKLMEGMKKILKHNKKNMISLKLFYSFKKTEMENLRFKNLEELSAVGYSSSYFLRKIVDKKLYDKLKTLEITFSTGNLFKDDMVYQMNITKLIIATFYLPENVSYQKFKKLKVLHLNCTNSTKAKLRITSNTLKKLYTVDEDGKWTTFVCSFVEIDCPRLKYLRMKIEGGLIIKRNDLKKVDFPRWWYPRAITINSPCKLSLFDIPLKNPTTLGGELVLTNLTKLEVYVHLFLVLKISSVKRLKILKLRGTSRKKVNYHYSYFFWRIGEFENLLELTLEDFSFVIFKKKGKKKKKKKIKKNENLKNLKVFNIPDIPITFEKFFRKFENMEYFTLKQICEWNNASKMRTIGQEIFGCLPKHNNLKNLSVFLRGIKTRVLFDSIKECKKLQSLKIDIVYKNSEGIIETEVLENGSVNSLIIGRYTYSKFLERIVLPNLKNLIMHGVVDCSELISKNILGNFRNLEEVHFFKDNTPKKLENGMDLIFDYIKGFEKRKLRVLSLFSPFEHFGMTFEETLEQEKKFLNDLEVNLHFSGNEFGSRTIEPGGFPSTNVKFDF